MHRTKRYLGILYLRPAQIGKPYTGAQKDSRARIITCEREFHRAPAERRFIARRRDSDILGVGVGDGYQPVAVQPTPCGRCRIEEVIDMILRKCSGNT